MQTGHVGARVSSSWKVIGMRAGCCTDKMGWGCSYPSSSPFCWLVICRLVICRLARYGTMLLFLCCEVRASDLPVD